MSAPEEIPDAPGAEVAAAPGSNADVFSDIVESTPTVSGSTVDLSVEPASNDATSGDVVGAPTNTTPTVTMADLTALLEEQAVKLTAEFDKRLASTAVAEPVPDAKPDDALPDPAADDDIFVVAAKSQIGADAEHAPPDLISDRAQLLDKQSGWVRWQRAYPDDAAGQARAQANIEALKRSLAANLRDIQYAAQGARHNAQIADLTEQVAAKNDRPARKSPEVVATEFNTGIEEHVVSESGKFPTLAKALASKALTASAITNGIDFAGDEKAIVGEILSRLSTWEAALSSIQPPAPDAATPPASKALANPGILAPGTAPAAAGLAPYPTNNADVWASIAKPPGIPN